MRKKQLMKNYIEGRVDFDEIRTAVHESPWLASLSVYDLSCNGLICSYFHGVTSEAIKKAGYKFPDSDRTLLTADSVIRELLHKYL